MAMTGIFTKRNGESYVVNVYDELSEPIRTYMWWPVLGIYAPYGRSPDEGDEVYDRRDGYWEGKSNSLVFTGNGEGRIVERVPVPPPPARGKPLRWYDGRWERLMAKGWVPAGEGQAQLRASTKAKAQLNRKVEQATRIRIRKS